MSWGMCSGRGQVRTEMEDRVLVEFRPPGVMAHDVIPSSHANGWLMFKGKKSTLAVKVYDDGSFYAQTTSVKGKKHEG